MVVVVTHKHYSIVVHCQSTRITKLSWFCSLLAKWCHPLPFRGEHNGCSPFTVHQYWLTLQWIKFLLTYFLETEWGLKNLGLVLGVHDSTIVPRVSEKTSSYLSCSSARGLFAGPWAELILPMTLQFNWIHCIQFHPIRLGPDPSSMSSSRFS